MKRLENSDLKSFKELVVQSHIPETRLKALLLTAEDVVKGRQQAMNVFALNLKGASNISIPDEYLKDYCVRDNFGQYLAGGSLLLVGVPYAVLFYEISKLEYQKNILPGIMFAGGAVVSALASLKGLSFLWGAYNAHKGCEQKEHVSYKYVSRKYLEDVHNNSLQIRQILFEKLAEL